MSKEQVATLAGGCFWCLEAVYQQMDGISRIVSGYMGGTVDRPTYQQVCAGNTGHAEVVEVRFDPDITTFRDILEVFFTIHDPTTKDRQGNDVGSQYRSAIFYHSEEQRKIAEEIIAELTSDRVFPGSIVTEVVPASTFYAAEDYHQNYFAQNSNQPYCMFVVAPKLEKFRAKFKRKARAAS